MSDEELALLAQAGGQEAESVLVERYAPMCRQIGAAYRCAGVDSQDLTSEALFGLVRCIRRFDPAMGSTFRAYARMTIVRCALEALFRAKEVQQHEVHRNPADAEEQMILRHKLPVLDDAIVEELQLRAVAQLMTRRQREMLAYLVQTGDVRKTASYFGCSQSRVYFVMKLLREKFKEEET